MRSQQSPRYQGKITSWKDDQGFGFITPNGGGPAVFVHISAFTSRGVRPAGDDIVTYYLGSNEKGARAEQVAFVRSPVSKRSSTGSRTGALITAVGFLALVALCVFTKKLPPLLLGAYLCASILAFLTYAADKSAARKNGRRTSENALHTIALAGGWPGALVAQQVLRHKSKKASFRVMFWATVIINCAVLVWLLTPSGAVVLSEVSGRYGS